MVELSSYDPQKWIDKGVYWLYDADQKDPDWHLVRKGRPSGSNCGYLIGHGNPQFGSKEDTVLEIVGKKEKVFDQRQRENMDHGVREEPIARDWYSETRKCRVEELGFVIPKWDMSIGVSVDGVIYDSSENKDEMSEKMSDGMIEIKCPKKMYYPLAKYIEQQKNNNSKEDDFSHIWKTHYDQMQLGMAVLGKKWCDYVVYCSPENSSFVQRIPFDYNYWKIEMYDKLKCIIQEEINPLLVGTNYPLMPTKF